MHNRRLLLASSLALLGGCAARAVPSQPKVASVQGQIPSPKGTVKAWLAQKGRIIDEGFWREIGAGSAKLIFSLARAAVVYALIMSALSGIAAAIGMHM